MRRSQNPRAPPRSGRFLLTFSRRYWNCVNDNGHLIEQSANASTQRLHELELLKDRIVWQGTAFKDWVIFARNRHPMMSMLLAVRMMQVLQSFYTELDSQMKDHMDNVIEPMPFISTMY